MSPFVRGTLELADLWQQHLNRLMPLCKLVVADGNKEGEGLLPIRGGGGREN